MKGRVALVLFLVGSARAASAAPLGAPCASLADCDSGFCADGVCCNRACDGRCETCLAEEKQGGKGTGTCGPVREGTDPRDECAATDATTCGQTGVCSGTTASCALFTVGTPCGTPRDTECQCQTTRGTICSGTGVCTPETSFTPCGGGDYVCVRDDGQPPGSCTLGPGRCASPCASDTDCSSNRRCVSGACVARLAQGARCTIDAECGSPSHCADGFCCDTACGRQCEACDLPGKEGTCSQVTGPPVGGRPVCTGSPPCLGRCGGSRDQCDYPDRATECVGGTCLDDSFVRPSVCDGVGLCAPGATQDCGEYACDTAAPGCRTRCDSHADCRAGSVCDLATHGCSAAGATCVDGFNVRTPDGTVSSCNGYACVAGRCQQQCGASAECAPGYECVGNGCVVATVGSGGGANAGGAGSAPVGNGGGVPEIGGSGPRQDGGAGDGGVRGDGGTGVVESSDQGGCGCRVVVRPSAFRYDAWAVLASMALALGRRSAGRRQRAPRGWRL